jgi:hypothetical protein
MLSGVYANFRAYQVELCLRRVVNLLFLSNRYLIPLVVFVQIGNNNSDLRTVTCGVPQGSILGPLFFILYINDIVHVSKLANLIMFADDTNLCFKDANLDILINTVNGELSKISHWFALNKLSLNIKKKTLSYFIVEINESRLVLI